MPRKRTMITYTCEWCGRERTVTRHYFRQTYPKGTDKPLACSRKCGCRLRDRGHSVDVVCPNCGKTNRRKNAHAKRKFCNHDCYIEYVREHPQRHPNRKFSPEAMQRLRSRTGENNPAYGLTGEKCCHWKGGRDGYRGKGWHTIRKLIKRRDGNTCVLCGRPASDVAQLDVHHIYDWAETHCNHPYNLITVCATCHQGAIHGNTPAPPNHQLVTLARKATREGLAQDDLLLIEGLDREQRRDKELPSYVAEILGLPDQPLRDKQQLPLPLFDQCVSLSHQEA